MMKTDEEIRNNLNELLAHYKKEYKGFRNLDFFSHKGVVKQNYNNNLTLEELQAHVTFVKNLLNGQESKSKNQTQGKQGKGKKQKQNKDREKYIEPVAGNQRGSGSGSVEDFREISSSLFFEFLESYNLSEKTKKVKKINEENIFPYAYFHPQKPIPKSEIAKKQYPIVLIRNRVTGYMNKGMAKLVSSAHTAIQENSIEGYYFKDKSGYLYKNYNDKNPVITADKLDSKRKIIMITCGCKMNLLIMKPWVTLNPRLKVFTHYSKRSNCGCNTFFQFRSAGIEMFYSICDTEGKRNLSV